MNIVILPKIRTTDMREKNCNSTGMGKTRIGLCQFSWCIKGAFRVYLGGIVTILRVEKEGKNEFRRCKKEKNGRIKTKIQKNHSNNKN